LKWILSQAVAPTVDTLRVNLGIDLETALLAKKLIEVMGPKLRELHLFS